MGSQPLRVGLIGLDMSHATEFTRRLNDARHPEHVPGGRVVAAWPGGSQDFELSWSRVAKFTAEVRDQHNVRIAESPEAVAESVDVLFITAADGRAHRALFERVVPFKRPTFIEKPLATSSADARAILALAEKSSVPVMSCSTARFGDILSSALTENASPIVGCDLFGPMPEEATQPGLFWYGVHSVEVLNVVMGHGCQEVLAYHNDDVDVVTAAWADGRVATFRGTRRGEWKFGMTLHRANGVHFVDLLHNAWYARTLEVILKHLPNGTPPVAAQDTLEIIRFIEAANESRRTGQSVRLSG